MSACWDHVVRATGDLWRLLTECRLGFTRKAAARILGFPSGDALDEDLRDRGLPPFRLLRERGYVVLLTEADAEGKSLWRWVLRQNGDPAMYYRFIRKITGLTWQEVKHRGPGWARAEACRIWSPYLIIPPAADGLSPEGHDFPES